MSSTEMGITVTDARIVSTAVETFSQLIEQYGRHAIAGEGGIVYEQPPVRISLHVMQMRSAGWLESFDQVATLSGASALFLYDRSSFMPKYAHTHIEPEARVADATGFGYEWLPFADAEEAWQIVRRSVNASRPVKGHHAEALLFAGYRDADQAAGRKVLTLLDGPETIRLVGLERL